MKNHCAAWQLEFYRVLEAKHGLEAVEIYRQQKNEISLVVLDLGLAELNGWEVFSRIRKEKGNVKIVVASGYIDPDARAKYAELDIDGFVQKPYHLSEMLDLLRKVLDQSGRKENHRRAPALSVVS